MRFDLKAARGVAGSVATGVPLFLVGVFLFGTYLGAQSAPEGEPIVERSVLLQQLNAQRAEVSPAARARIQSAVASSREAKQRRRAGGVEKVSSVLRHYAELPRTRRAESSLIRQFYGSVPVEIAVASTTAEALAPIRGLGVNITSSNASQSVVTALLDPGELLSQLNALSRLSVVRRVRPVVGERTYSGAVLSEGEIVQGIGALREHYKVDGSGVCVGVISDGINSAPIPVLSGDLPGDGIGLPAIETCPLNVNEGDEGTAMLEIIHDLAPGAHLAFCPAFGPFGQQGLAFAIDWLANQANGGNGCDIIVDDVAYVTEPHFEDGIIAQSVDAAAAKGKLYFSSAGNSANAHYEYPFLDSTPGESADEALADLHDFGTAAGLAPDASWLGVVAPGGNFIAVFMQWPEPFGQAGIDFDLYLFDLDGFPVGSPFGTFPSGANGTDFQFGAGDPLEVAFAFNDTADVQPFLIVVDLFDGPGEELLIEMDFNGLFAVDPTYNIPVGAIWGHAAARGAQAVAATGAVFNVDGTPNPDHNLIEPFSSLGPSIIAFDTEGNFDFEARLKPDITGLDGVSVTGVGFQPVFYGTSASAPHLAGIAALLAELDKERTHEELEQILEANGR